MAERKNKIIKNQRTSDAINLTLKDILSKDLFTDTEMQGRSVGKPTNTDFDKINIYIDAYEKISVASFNLSVNCDPVGEIADKYYMYLVSGNSNEQGTNKYEILGFDSGDADNTIVNFEIPSVINDFKFSYHKDGYSYSNFAIYAGIKDGVFSTGSSSDSKLLMCKGKVIKSDVLFDMVETVGK